MLIYKSVDLSYLTRTYALGMRKFPDPSDNYETFLVSLSISDETRKAKRSAIVGDARAGYVLSFEIHDNYDRRAWNHGQNGSSEFAIAHSELVDLNANLIGPILIETSYFGQEFLGMIPTRFGLRGKDATMQFVALASIRIYGRMDFTCEVQANNAAVFLNYPFWKQHDFSDHSIDQRMRDVVLEDISVLWAIAFPNIRLGGDKDIY